MQLTEYQIYLIGLVALMAAQGVKLIAAKSGKKLDRKPITAFLFVVSVFLAYIWYKPALPTLVLAGDDPAAVAVAVINFITALVAAASSILGVAVIVYNLLAEKFFEKLGVGKSLITELLEQFTQQSKSESE